MFSNVTGSNILDICTDGLGVVCEEYQWQASVLFFVNSNTIMLVLENIDCPYFLPLFRSTIPVLVVDVET